MVNNGIKILIVGCLLCFCFNLIAGRSDSLQLAPREFIKEDFVNQLDSLKNLYGKNKTLLEGYELQILLALSFYPELKETEIEFKRKKIKTTMAARPVIGSLLKKNSKRKYLVILNESETAMIPLDSASFNAHIGVLGHELAHIVYYEQVPVMQLLVDILQYPSEKFRSKFETNTDICAIKHGLGWQLYDYEAFCQSYPHAPQEYKDYKKRIYLLPRQIRKLTVQHHGSHSH